MYLSEIRLNLVASESKFEKCSDVTETLLGVWKGEYAGEYVVNWLKGSRVLMFTFVNTFLSFVF